MRERRIDYDFKQKDETYAQSFCDWWETAEPFGYDNPDTYNPIVRTFEGANKEIQSLKQELEKVKRERDGGKTLNRQHHVRFGI